MGVHEKTEYIIKQFDENKNSHIFLIDTDNLDLALEDVKRVISNILKADVITKNQIMEENYIELIIIRPTNEFIIKDDILNLQAQVKTKPILSNKKFYIIYDADALNDVAANKLLKTIEEPQEGVFGFLITDNISSILSTIKSLCQIEKFYYKKVEDTERYSKDDLELANKIIEIIEEGDLKDFILYKTNDKKVKEYIKSNGKLVANIIKNYYNNSCEVEKVNWNKEVANIIKRNNAPYERIAKAKYLNKLMSKITQNMNVELLIDKMILDLKEVKIDASSWDKI